MFMQQIQETDIQQYIDSNVTEQDRILFPVRKFNKQKNSLGLSESFMKRLEMMLSCPICNRRIEDPVYLICSHRFCRTCLSGCLNEKRKKYCPACVVDRPISACRRDMKSDLQTDKFIQKLNEAFQVKQFNDERLLNVENHKRQMFELHQQEMEPPRKKFRNNAFKDLYQQKIDSLFTPDKCSEESNSSTELNTSEKNGVLGKMPSALILIKQQNEENEYNDERLEVDSRKQKQSQGQQSQKYSILTSPYQKQTFQQRNQPISLQKKEDPIHQAFEHFSSRFRGNQLQKGQFSQNLSLDLNYSFHFQEKPKNIKILLKKHPDDFLSPPLSFSQIMVSATSNTSSIVKLIADEFNIQKKQVKIYLYDSSNKKCSYIPSNNKISDLKPIDLTKNLEITLGNLAQQFTEDENSLMLMRYDCKIFYRVVS